MNRGNESDQDREKRRRKGKTTLLEITFNGLIKEGKKGTTIG